MSVTPDYLLRGYALALEQCGLLLRDAVRLYEAGSYATAIVLAAFAQEELGRSQDLLDLWRGQRDGTPVTGEQIKMLKHLDKQRAGMLSLTLRADRETDVGKLLVARTTNAPYPQSQEWKNADERIRQIAEQMAERTPEDRHNARVRALYVEPTSNSEWNRPADISVQTAHVFLMDAVNDYSGRYHQSYITSDQPMLKHIDVDLYDGLTQLADRPQLPIPVQPSWPK